MVNFQSYFVIESNTIPQDSRYPFVYILARVSKKKKKKKKTVFLSLKISFPR